jgi:hypothetical protein
MWVIDFLESRQVSSAAGRATPRVVGLPFGPNQQTSGVQIFRVSTNAVFAGVGRYYTPQIKSPP